MKKFEKLKTRYIFATVILAIYIPFSLIVFYTGMPGRIIAFVGYLILGTYGIFEFIHHLHLKWYSKVYICSLFFIVMLFEWGPTVQLLGVGNSDIRQLKNVINFYSLGIPAIALTLLFIIEPKKFTLNKLVFIVFIFWILGIFIRTIYFLNILSYKTFLFILFLPIISDTSAYFGGILYGKKKIFPKISPNKTWEGSITGFLLTALYIGIFGYFGHIFQNTRNEYVALSFAIILLPIAAQAGDFVFSLVKRNFGIKDFSNIIPGHGGYIDRIDSHTFTSLIFILIFVAATGFNI